MGIMKRQRVDEVQFSTRPGNVPGGPGGGVGVGGPTAAHHRILTSQHNTGPPIQYQLAPANPTVLKTTVSGSINTDNVQVSTLSLVGGGQPTQTVQYTTAYTTAALTATGVSKTGVSIQGTVGTAQVVPPVQVVAPSNANSSVAMHAVNAVSLNTTSIRHKTITTAPINQQSLTPQPAGPGPQGGGPTPRLKVEDALSYLDQVKYQYADQPQIYNNFLDIMKEFKSQCIDTPGVIQRVSNLFKGHTELIYGFNMFLPPGYKIEIQSNDQGISVPVVSMPSPPGGGTVPCLAQASPVHKPGSIIHQIPSSAAVNLMTHSATTPQATGITASVAPTIHAALPPPPQQQQQQPQQQQQQQQTQTQIVPPTPPQGYRERTVSQSGSIGSVVTVGGPSTPNSVNDMTTSQGHNLHHISQAHQSILQGESLGQQNQPVEFNHAISYVNKIKNRFQTQPEKYKRFLEILHTYQKEQKVLKETSGNMQQSKQLTEAEVYTQVAKLFDQQEDLLREFGQFLPDATSHSTAQFMSKAHIDHNKKMSSFGGLIIHPLHSGPAAGLKGFNNNQNNLSRLEREHFEKEYHSVRDKERNHLSQKFGQQAKKSPSYNSLNTSHLQRRGDDRDGAPPAKRHKPICRDVTFAEASRYGTLADAAFFDKVRKALRNPDAYENFLRCLALFNHEVICKSELVTVVSPFLSKFPELHRFFQDFLGPSNGPEGISLATAQRQERSQGGELAQEIDLTTCKRLGASYCALPKTTEPKKCSGRTQLCREVLNDTWVSFPTWASEDSTFVTSRKTQFEEIIYRCEDERFELDVVIETNSGTIRVLEGVQKKLSRMSQDDVARYRLDDCLGGNSPTIHQRALKRIYGDKAGEIIQGLKKNPFVAVPVVLRRLKAKEEEWREAQKNFNKQWREQNEKYYLKSLDHQAVNFKPNDIKSLRSKSLFNEIEAVFDERHDQNEENGSDTITGPHLILPYKDKTIIEDAANLLIHHVKRQTGIQKQEKTKIKHILRQFVPDLFFSPRQPLSDDERDDDDKEMDADPSDTDSLKAIAKSSGPSSATSSGTSINLIASTHNKLVENNKDSTLSSTLTCTTPNSSTTTSPLAGFSSQSTASAIQSASVTAAAAATSISGTTPNNTNISTTLTTTLSRKSESSSSERTQCRVEDLQSALAATVAATAAAVTSASCGNPSANISCSGGSNSKSKSSSPSLDTATASGVNSANIVGDNKVIKSDTSSSTTTSVDGVSPTQTASLVSGDKIAQKIDGNSSSSVDIKVEVKDEEMDIDAPVQATSTLPPHAISKHLEEAYVLFLANSNWYLFLRLHAILCERLRTMYERAQILAFEEAKYRSIRRDSTATALRLKPKSEVQVEDYYPTFLEMLKNVLDGNMDSNNYEDSLREMFGIHAYIAFTLDRVVSNAVRQLQHCVTERGAIECVELFHTEQRKGGAGGPCRLAYKRIAAELAYQRRAEASLHDENCFKVYIYKVDCRVTIELLDTEPDDAEKCVSNAQVWSNFVERLTNPAASGVQTLGQSGSGGATTSNSGSNGGGVINSGTSNPNKRSSCAGIDAFDSLDIKSERSDYDVLLSNVPRRPLYLRRNVNSFNSRYSVTKTIKSTTEIDLSSVEDSDMPETTTTTAAATATTTTTQTTSEEVTAKITSETTATSTTTTTASTTILTAITASTTSTTSSTIDTSTDVTPSTTSISANTVPNAINQINRTTVPFWGKRPPERMGAGANYGLNQQYFIEDREEVKINQQTYKMFFVVNKDVMLYKKNAIRRAKETHSRVTCTMHTKFQKFVNKWLDKSVTDVQKQQCNDWLMGRTADLAANKTTICQENDVTKTPYKKYNRYKVITLDS